MWPWSSFAPWTTLTEALEVPDDDGQLSAPAFIDGSTVRAPTASRTLVIVLSDVVVIVALLVLWSVLRRSKNSD
jgi:hypothetical protein